jgi:hypothetical protein
VVGPQASAFFGAYKQFRGVTEFMNHWSIGTIGKKLQNCVERCNTKSETILGEKA